MKKYLLLLVFVLLLTGCMKEEKGKITCTLNSNDVINNYKLDAKYVINYVNDIVEFVETEEIVTSSDSSTLSYFENYLNDTYKKMNDSYSGYEYSITNANGKVTAKVKIDYNKMDINQYIIDQPSLKSYVKDNKFKKDGLKSIYESMGAECQ